MQKRTRKAVEIYGPSVADTSEDAENMRLRSELMMALEKHIAARKLTQVAAAKIFGVTQPRVSDLLRGKVNVFSLDSLVTMAAKAGLHVKMHIVRERRAA